MRENRPVIVNFGGKTKIAFIQYFDSGEIKIYLTAKDLSEGKSYKTFSIKCIKELMYELEDLSRMKYAFRVMVE